MEEDVKRLKNIKKNEILERAKKVQKISAKKTLDSKKIEQIIEEDFDEEKFNKKMEQEFGE
jgi:KRI1-like family